YRFWLTGQAAQNTSAPVTLTFLPNSWSYYLSALPTTIAAVTVTVTQQNGAYTAPVTVQITIPDANAGNTTDPNLAGYTIDPNSLDLTKLTFHSPDGWTMVIDPTRRATLVNGTTDAFNIPVIITLPTITSSTLSSISTSFSVTLKDTQWASFYGPPNSAVAGTSGDSKNTYTAASFPSRSYLDVTLVPASGQQIDSNTIPGTGNITLAGSGTGTVSFDSGSPNPVSLGGNVYRYLLDGSFVAGTVNLTIKANTFRSANLPRGPPWTYNLEQDLSFTVQGPTADVVWGDPTSSTSPVTSLNGGSVGRTVIDSAGYIEIAFNATSGQTIDSATINGNEIQVRDASGNPVTLTGTPTRVGTTNIWRYGFSGALTDGTYTVTFLAGSFGDTSGATNQLSSETFTVAEATSSLTGPGGGSVVNQTQVNGHGWLDITFPTINGSAVSQSSITSSTSILTLSDANNDPLALDGTPVLIDPTSSVYRFFFVGDTSGTAPSSFTITFNAGAWTDSSGNAASSANFPTASNITGQLGSWVDVTLIPTPGSTVDTTTFLPTGFVTLSGPGANGVTEFTGGHPVVAIGPAGAHEYRVLLTGTFGTGAVTVTLPAGAWSDSAGNASLAASASFTVVAPAQAFFIELSGGLIVNDPTGTTSQPLLSITGDVKLTIDTTNKVINLSFTGQMTVIGLGTVGATAGFFVVDYGHLFQNGLQIWGVASMNTNFSKLAQYGIGIYASAYLEINLSGAEHHETISLPGLGPNGGPLVQNYDLQPFTFAVAAAGKLTLGVPGLPPLMSVNGGFYIALSLTKETIYVTGSTMYGQATGLIIVRTGLDSTPQNPVTPGVAGLLTVGKSDALAIPGVGNLFSVSGSVSIMFNTTMQDQSFVVPQMFLPLLPAGAPTTITVYGATPGPSGVPVANTTPAAYLVATIQAQLTIGGVLTLNGFIQLSVGVTSGLDTQFTITGEVGTTIP
ncbi:MAG: mucin9, partial [Mucilaginibacter sp.]|nr:mucin9 [Mucilaginibacter sp.]